VENTRWIKTDQKFKKGSVVEITEPNKDKKTYKVVMSSDILNKDKDGYYVTVFEEINKRDNE